LVYVAGVNSTPGPARESQRAQLLRTLHDKAMQDLRNIRAAMDGSRRFTGVSGLGEIVIGVIALVAAWYAQQASDRSTWIQIWLSAAVLAFLAGVGAMVWKAHVTGKSVFSRPARRFVLGLAPPMVIAAAITPLLYRHGLSGHLPAVWLLLFGAAVVGGGAFSVEAVPLMGGAFMLLGGLALMLGPAWGDLFMALGFGGLHLLFGAWIWRRYGG
jgi:hypothetical protein